MSNNQKEKKLIALDTTKEANRHEEFTSTRKLLENKDETISELAAQIIKSNEIVRSIK